MNCPTCGGPMTPMIYNWFCPKDCDRPIVRRDPRPIKIR